MYDPHLHLLVDDAEIQYRRNMTRFVERPQRVRLEPVFRAEEAWEGGAVHLWGSVLWDPALKAYAMWYLVRHPDWSGQYHDAMGYATSPDGVSWKRGDFDHVEHPGFARSGMVYAERRAPEVRRIHPFTVLRDPLATDPEQRFKFIGFFGEVEGGGRGYIVAYSPDGVHWAPHPERVYLPRGDRTSVMQDLRSGGFLMVSRHDHSGRDRRTGHAMRRNIAVSRSPDLLEWTPSVIAIDADDDDPPATEFYGMPVFQWGNQYLGFLEYYDPRNEILNVQLATSRDGDRWERACSRRTYFDVGSSDGWDSTWVAFAFSPPQVRGDEMLLWYTGRPMAHRDPQGKPQESAIGLARAPRDRFAGLRAGPDGGELTTCWVEVGGGRLLLNIGAARGPVSVAVTGDDATPVPGYGHEDYDGRIASGVDVEATWAGKDLTALVGRRVRLHFRITYATLYAYRFDGIRGPAG